LLVLSGNPPGLMSPLPVAWLIENDADPLGVYEPQVVLIVRF
jgi:hypothetical protein